MVLYLIKMAIFFIGIVPVLISEIYASIIIIPIIGFTLYTIYLIHTNRGRLIIYNILIHFSVFCTHKAFSLNPGVDDTFKGLSEMTNSITLACAFGILTLVLLIVFRIRMSKY